MKILPLLLVTAMIPACARSQEVKGDSLNRVADGLAPIYDMILHLQAKSQSRLPAHIEVTGKKVTVRQGAAKNAPISFFVNRGEVLPVLDKAGRWYAIAKGKNTGWISADYLVPLESRLSKKGLALAVESEGTGETAKLLRQLIVDRINGLRNSLKNDASLALTGFSINLAIPPSVTVQFEYK